jgi:hypothetical protein
MSDESDKETRFINVEGTADALDEAIRGVQAEGWEPVFPVESVGTSAWLKIQRPKRLSRLGRVVAALNHLSLPLGILLGIAGTLVAYRAVRLADRTLQRDEARRRLEDERAGLLVQPQLELDVRKEGCVLVNTGDQKLKEVSLDWRLFLIDEETCRVRSLVSPGFIEPAATIEELAPGGWLVGPSKTACDPPGCQKGDRCDVVAECEAHVHRESDGRRFTAYSHGLFVGATCELEGFSVGTVIKDGALVWEDPRKQRLAECFSQNYQSMLGLAAHIAISKKLLDEAGDLRARTP